MSSPDPIVMGGFVELGKEGPRRKARIDSLELLVSFLNPYFGAETKVEVTLGNGNKLPQVTMPVVTCIYFYVFKSFP